MGASLNQAICSLFKVIQDEQGLQRIVTPFEYVGTGDSVVVRVRARGNSWQIDENGEAAFYASMNGGDIEKDNIIRWANDGLPTPAKYNADDETIIANVSDELQIAPAILRVAQAAQTLYSLATNRSERVVGDFKERLTETILSIAATLDVKTNQDVILPNTGELVADFVIESPTPLIIIAATSTTRLLEAEIIHLQYQNTKTKGFVLAIAENQNTVGKKQFERANYYTGKTVSYNPSDLAMLIQRNATH